MRIVRHLGTSLFVILGSVAFGVVGQLLLKGGANNLTPATFDLNGLSVLISEMFSEPLVMLGYPFFIAGAFLWLVVLSRHDLSFAYPFLGVQYLLITLFSWLVLGEEVAAGRWLAVSLIVFGILLVGQSEVLDHPRRREATEPE